MFELQIPGREEFNEETNEFISHEPMTVRLEHSLATISLWESKWELPFLSSDEKTSEQVLDYVRIMSDGVITDQHINSMTQTNFKEVNDFINSKHSATWFADDRQKTVAGRSTEVITSELIYYWMVAFQIPFECQYWHLYRLMTLIRVCNAKLNHDPKKKSTNRSQMAAERRRLNEARKAQYNTTG